MIPELITGTAEHAHLPLGRYPTTLAEVHARYVDHPDFAGSTTRADRWQRFLALTDLLRSFTTVCVAWLGGSFTTAKPDPDDLDVVYVLDRRAAEGLSNPLQHAVLARVARRGVPLLDTFVILWVPHHDGPASDTVKEYRERRGYWDDWWQRNRHAPAWQPPVPPDAIPERGYLEVMLDGFAV